jgi:hypothetical protein
VWREPRAKEAGLTRRLGETRRTRLELDDALDVSMSTIVQWYVYVPYTPHHTRSKVGSRGPTLVVTNTPLRIVSVVGGMDHGTKFRRGVGGPLVGGIDIMMSFEPRLVARLACSPLLHYTLCVAKPRRCYKRASEALKLYGRIVVYDTRARRQRARADASLMRDEMRCSRARATLRRMRRRA